MTLRVCKLRRRGGVPMEGERAGGRTSLRAQGRGVKQREGRGGESRVGED